MIVFFLLCTIIVHLTLHSYEPFDTMWHHLTLFDTIWHYLTLPQYKQTRTRVSLVPRLPSVLLIALRSVYMHTEVEEGEKWLFVLFHFCGCVSGSSTLFSSTTSLVQIRRVSTCMCKWGGHKCRYTSLDGLSEVAGHTWGWTENNYYS